LYEDTDLTPIFGSAYFPSSQLLHVISLPPRMSVVRLHLRRCQTGRPNSLYSIELCSSVCRLCAVTIKVHSKFAMRAQGNYFHTTDPKPRNILEERSPVMSNRCAK